MNATLKLLPCHAPVWARSGHAQTLWGFGLPSAKVDLLSEKQYLPLADGDQLVLRYTPGDSSWVVYLFHGLTGDASSAYMARIAKLSHELGHSVYRVNHRDCGEGLGLARHPYHCGRGEDIAAVLALGKQQHPHKKHIAIGFSLSGNALLTLLAGLKGSVWPDYAISVNAPIDLHASATRIHQGFNKIYNYYFVQRLRQAVRLKRQAGHWSPQALISPFSALRQFDDWYTAPAAGFASVDEYYRQCSTHQHLHRITIPTVLLTAQDDPFVPVNSYLQARLSASVHLHIEKTGGHMGYLSRHKTPLGTHRWLDYALHQCLQRFTAT